MKVSSPMSFTFNAARERMMAVKNYDIIKNNDRS